MPRSTVAAALLAVTALSSSCSGSSSSGAGAHNGITVFAASSLTNAFTDAATAFRQKTGTKVTLSFAGSQDLVAQVQQGAPADVVATADTTTMADVADELAAPSNDFARNKLVIAVAPHNPKHIHGLADLAKASVVLADPSVPAGKYAAQALDDAHVAVQPKSLELDVRSVLTKVELGEADAGIVYVTDVKSAGDKVTSVPITEGPTATYALGALTKSGQPFVDFVLSDQGLAILDRYGFLPP